MAKKRAGGGLSPVQLAARFLGVSVLAGGVLAGIALPGVGALGLATKGTVKEFDEIPADLKRPPLTQRSKILDAKGGEIATVYYRDRTVVDAKDMSPYVQKALVAIEDSRFYEHGAIDLKGVLRAVNQNAQSGGVAQGASTLTQQYVKNVFIEEAGDDPDKVAQATQQTMGRKIQELKYAIQIEKELGKKKILENYLNITFFGQGAYGVEAASQRYFSKHAKDLTVEQAALLAGIVQSPSRYDPINDPKEATDRRNTVLRRMSETHAITPAEAKEAQAKPLGLKVTPQRSGCITASRGAGFFCDYVEHVFLNDPAFGKTKGARLALWKRGGLTIQTTLDPQAQNSLQGSLSKHVYTTDRVTAAGTLVEPGTGKILAMGQASPYGTDDKKHQTTINYNVNHDMGGSNFGFQTGSTFKPFVAAAAIEQGVAPTKEYPSPYEMDYPSPVTTCQGTYTNEKNETVHNENESEKGPYVMKEAMAKSINTYFVSLISEVGVCPVTKMTDKLHVVLGNGNKLPQLPAIALGASELSPLTLSSAYAAFASRGVYCTPVAINSVTGMNGKPLPVPKSQCQRAMSEKTADTITTLLNGVIDSGTGKEAGLGDRPSAGKTGTTDERKNAWFAGYTPNLAAAVWVGSATQKVKMHNVTIGGVFQEYVYGGQVPGPIWRDAMAGALAGKPTKSFHLIDIPDPKKKDKKKPGDEGKPRDDQGDDDGDGGGDDKPDFGGFPFGDGNDGGGAAKPGHGNGRGNGGRSG
ncbi:transglycosylase domain-containing protein [Streptomyces sp. SPB074]|uniref:transglycosylase domain-containing protein n=1 Tax=Streptomyces sp. (strain SPB074) TaxID=465543 RepID=UPI00017F210D|nr:transglycosylase domain-containing protein [Streptomyces sp. SPB074]EDY46619.1 penicillin-binding protein [Streptomyces sp. SPB074]